MSTATLALLNTAASVHEQIRHLTQDAAAHLAAVPNGPERPADLELLVELMLSAETMLSDTAGGTGNTVMKSAEIAARLSGLRHDQVQAIPDDEIVATVAAMRAVLSTGSAPAQAIAERLDDDPAAGRAFIAAVLDA